MSFNSNTNMDFLFKIGGPGINIRKECVLNKLVSMVIQIGKKRTAMCSHVLLEVGRIAEILAADFAFDWPFHLGLLWIVAV